ncbi:(deoxy)nucleoside triphosphate pyrophosphohydrolase [Ravibacter arvi]|uniref:8-oxo-dGTP diphosphatase n=1 Tax=Ravibacter arvi TaxID=2051041 RepID=A0ABP8LSH0_9BACT
MPEVEEKVSVPVPCAIIEKDGRILVAQRNALGSLPLKWEFPGGKQEKGETEEEGLAREIMEELSVQVEIGKRLPATSRDDGWREIVLIPFVCTLPVGQQIFLTEHEQMRWLSRTEFYTVDWAEADRNVLKTYEAYLDRSF